jgi:hypothetical protein
MPRPNRLVLPSVPHHITQRGTYRQTVLFRAVDRLFYWQLNARVPAPLWRRTGGPLPHGQPRPLDRGPPGWEGFVAGAATRPQRLRSDYVRATRLGEPAPHEPPLASLAFTPLTEEKHCWDALLNVERNPVRAGLVERCCQWRGRVPKRRSSTRLLISGPAGWKPRRRFRFVMAFRF